MNDVVAIANIGNFEIIQMAALLFNGQYVGHDLAGVVVVGEPVNHRNGGVLGQLEDVGMVEEARHDDVIGLHVSDPLEKELPRPDLYTITNGVTRSRINTSVRRHRRDYERHYEDKLEYVRAEFARIKSPLVEVVTNEATVSQIAARFNASGV